ncbi:helix-turn-helix transcriptional regulator [Halobacillus rhizosphaerae]|uniref:helix-turn-helix domain-containing protein n=1 Tax=Halobacillus rhizosphaerae TaxID=3064889 RepID=UPI00398A7CDE
MENLGSYIKYFRKKNKITQRELAKGIISVSYLSRIENNIEQPSREISNLLKDRLGIQENELQTSQNVVQQLKKCYKEIAEKKLDSASKRLKSYEKLMVNQKSLVSDYYYKVVRAFYCLYNQEFTEAAHLLAGIGEIELVSLDKEGLYYYSRIKALHDFYQQKYESAYKLLNEARSLRSRLTDNEAWETAELNYILGLTTSKLRLDPLSIHYTREALAFYQTTYHFKRSAQCHLLLGITYERTNLITIAKEQLSKAIKIAKNIDDTLLISKACHNLAHHFVTKGESLRAIEEFQICYDYKLKANVPDHLLLSTIFCMVTEYYRLEEYIECRKWAEQGLEIIRMNEYDHSYYYHFQILLKYIKVEPDFETFASDHAIPHFRSISKMEYVVRYTHLLGSYYQSLHKYKQAAACYEESLALFNSKFYTKGLLL